MTKGMHFKTVPFLNPQICQRMSLARESLHVMWFKFSDPDSPTVATHNRHHARQQWPTAQLQISGCVATLQCYSTVHYVFSISLDPSSADVWCTIPTEIIPRHILGDLQIESFSGF